VGPVENEMSKGEEELVDEVICGARGVCNGGRGRLEE